MISACERVSWRTRDTDKCLRPVDSDDDGLLKNLQGPSLAVNPPHAPFHSAAEPSGSGAGWSDLSQFLKEPADELRVQAR
jgi:hypothetical protein